MANGKPGPRRVTNFNQWVIATGGRPLLRVGDQRLLAGYFDVAVTITDNAVVAADLALASVWDLRVQQFYGSAAARLEAILRLAAVQLYINDSAFREETEANKEALDNLAYITMTRSANTMKLPLRGCIFEPWAQPAGLTTAQLALTEDRNVFKGRPRRLERPLQIDLKTDILQFNVDTAINMAGNITGYVRLFGHLAPRDYPGAMVSDADVCAETPATIDASVGPQEFAQMTLAGFGGVALAPALGAVQSG